MPVPCLSPNVRNPLSGVWNERVGLPALDGSAMVAWTQVRPPSCVAAMRIGMLSDVMYMVSASTSSAAEVVDQPGG